jgi:superoxide reductase
MAEVLRAGLGNMVCCNQPMRHTEENTTDAAREKHVPVLARAGADVTVTIGGVPHPMGDEHYIEWIEVVQGDTVTRQYLRPGVVPQVTFELPSGPVGARAFCNLHGLWKSEI